MPLPVDAPGTRVVTVVEDQGAPVAALVHDPAALRDETLAQSVAAAVRLALANVRLQVDVAARVREVAASRRRLVEAGDEQRRRLRDELRSGAELGLADVSRGLAGLAADRSGETAATLSTLVAELDAARGDLARFAQGVHPRSLTEHGLSSALDELATRPRSRLSSRCPRGASRPRRRRPRTSCARRAWPTSPSTPRRPASRIAVDAAGQRLIVRVADDGRGGADPSRGSGLRGLADRVAALGGALSVDSPPGGGTRLTADLPIGAGS